MSINNVGSVKLNTLADGSQQYDYVAYDNEYVVSDLYLGFSNLIEVEKDCQKTEQEFNLFKTALNSLDTNHPPVKIEIQEGDFFLATNLDDEKFNFKIMWSSLDNGSTEYYNSLFEAGHYGPETTFNTVIDYLEHCILHCKREISIQGYALDDKKIALLIVLDLISESPDHSLIVGEIEDWIPYVYAGIEKDILLGIFDIENNPDYEKTGKLSISIDDYKSISNEIIRQGYPINNEQIMMLIKLQLGSNLAGKMSDWIPYVYAGIEKDILLGIFDIENNPDYEKTGKLSISIDDYKSKFANIHPSFAKLLLK